MDKPWKLAYQSKPKGPMVVAEPTHRRPPEGVTSGMSYRTLPKSSVEEVRDICLHYVEKCSGKYSHNSVAARYVHQMAEEVINQLSGVAEDIKRHMDEPEVLQKLLDEWNDSFPPSLGELGTPKAIAAKLEKQERHIEDLKTEIDILKSKHEAELNRITRSVSAQLEASRKGVISERKQLALKSQYSLSELQRKLQTQENENLENMKRMKEQHDKEVYGLTLKLERVTDEFQQRLKMESQEHSAIVKQLENTLQRERASAASTKETLIKKHQVLWERYQSLRSGFVPLTSAESAAEMLATGAVEPVDLSVIDGMSPDEEAPDHGLEASEASKEGAVVSAPLTAVDRVVGVDRPVQRRSVAPAVSAPTTTPSSSSYVSLAALQADAKELVLLKKQHQATVQDLQRTVQLVNTLTMDVERLLEALSTESRHRARIEEENRLLQFAMAQGQSTGCVAEGARVVHGERQKQRVPWSHTPHLLQQTRSHAIQ